MTPEVLKKKLEEEFDEEEEAEEEDEEGIKWVFYAVLVAHSNAFLPVLHVL